MNPPLISPPFVTPGTGDRNRSVRHGGTSPDLIGFAVAIAGGVIASFDLSPNFIAVALASVVLLPACVTWLSRRTLLVADPIILLGLVWVVGVSIPILFPDLYVFPPREHLSTWSFDTAALWMFRAFVAMALGYWSCRVSSSARPQAQGIKLPVRTGYRMRFLIATTGLGATILSVYLTGGQGYTNLDLQYGTSSLLEISGELQRFSALYVFLYFQARGRGALVPQDKWLLGLVLAGQAVLLSASATKLIGIQLIAAFALGNAASSTLHRNLFRQIIIIAIAGALTYMVFAFIGAYRIEIRDRYVNSGESFGAVISEQIDSIESAVAKITGLEQIPSGERAEYRNVMFDRLNHVTNFARLLNYTGPDSPYENSYASLLVPFYALVPRDLVSGKVQFFGSGDFARLMGWPFGGLSFTTPGSFFWAWGFEGIVPGMLFLGVALGFLSRGAERAGSSGLTCQLLLILLTIELLDVGVEFQAVITNLTRALVIFIAFQFATASQRQTQTSRPVGSPGGFPYRIDDGFTRIPSRDSQR